MSSLLFSNKELNLTRDFINEAFNLFGIDCEVYTINSANMYMDDRTLNHGIPYKILLQEYIDTRLLSNLKWSTVDTNREAIVALAPITYNGKEFNLLDLSVIKLANGDLYQIREVNSTYLISTSYVLKLISYHDEQNRPREAKQMKTNYFHVLKNEIE